MQGAVVGALARLRQLCSPQHSGQRCMGGLQSRLAAHACTQALHTADERRGRGFKHSMNLCCKLTPPGSSSACRVT